MPKLPVVKVAEVIKVLCKAGFVRWRQKGSHLSLYREQDNRSLTVPMHFGQDMPNGTLRAIIDQACMTVEEFLELRKK